MELKKKQGIYLMFAGAVVLVGVLVGVLMFVFGMPGTAPGDTPTATSTEPVATTTDIFDMEPIVPEAKVSTEGWKTCRNEEYGWEVKYPGEWVILGAASDNPNDRSFAASGNCLGLGATMSSNIDPGDWERKDFVVRALPYFLGVHITKPSIITVDDLLTLFMENKVMFGNVVVDGQPAIYQRLRSNSMTGGYKINMFLEHPYQGVMTLSFSNIEPDVRDTILSTMHFSTSTGELGRANFLNEAE